LFLVCGLGNKGGAYRYTRHNVGYLVLEMFSEKIDVPLSKKVAGCVVGEGDDFLLAKADTYMNLSGGPISALMRKRRILPEQLLVVHDDLDMDFGRMKIRRDGGDGGHKGVRSLIEALHTPLFFRIKIGIGRDPAMLPEDYVLSRFRPDELTALSEACERAGEAVGVFLAQGGERAMNMFNRQ
jgi:PTH1 family peptidyl-tRNA hydrolase